MADPIHPLKSYRERKRLSQQELAEMLGVSRAMVGLIETGKRSMNARRADRVARETGVPRECLCPDVF